MPKKLSEASTGGAELIFPDEAPYSVYRVRESAIYSAEEVRDEIGTSDVPRFGSWLPVEADEKPDSWLLTPSALISALQDAGVEKGDVFEIETLEKSGPQQSDPYRAKIEVQDPEQDRIDT